MLDKLKSLLFSGGPIKKTLKWILVVIVLLLAIWGIRSCSHHERLHKTVYRIGRDSSWYPFQLLGKEKNLVAFTNDLIKLIGQENDLRWEWVEVNPGSLVDGLDNGSYDLMLSSILPNIVNQKKYEFSELIFEFGPVLLVRQDSKVSSLGDMRGKTIGIPAGFSPIFNAVRAAGAHSYDLLVVTYTDIYQALNALANNQIDGVIMHAMPAYSDTQGLHAGKLKVVTAPLSDEGLRFVALRGSNLEEVIESIDNSVNEMRSNGTYKSLIAKWDLIDAETDYWHPQEEKAE